MFEHLGIASNILMAGLRYAKKGFKNVSDEDYNRRLLICAECNQFNNDWCKKCGCFLPAKAKMASEICPLGKWEPQPESPLQIQHMPCGGCGKRNEQSQPMEQAPQ